MNFTQTVDLSNVDDFMEFYKLDEVLCVTLMPRPPANNQLKEDTLLNGHFANYCEKHQITYYFQKEDAAQTHYHGLIRFPDNKTRKNFVKWYNRSYGKFYVSDKSDPDGWYGYVHKDCPDLEYVEVIDNDILDPNHL